MLMKTYLQYSSILLLSLLFAACDTAPYPIDRTPNVKVDTRLLGNWKMKGRPEEYTLIKYTDYKYMILYKDRRRNDIDKYPAFLSDVDSVKFLNITSEDDSTAGYFFLRIININPIKNVVTVAGLKDSTLKDITDPAEVREHISKNLNNPAHYGDTGYFYRIR